ncbi:hypothetical protein PAHAL_6G144500 [Panicum hallii]|uniref:Uncharacterized protein n=1 Tax=Panicum hallii TaxID=206008 RepID=A0A2S3I1P6_9POAL|nr:hypothetical protein PAHAL_6G144500 [Panicum hallii]
MVEVADLCASMSRMEEKLRRMNEILDRMNGVVPPPSSSTASTPSSPTLARVTTTRASAPSPATAAATTANVVGTNSPSPTAPATSPTSQGAAPSSSTASGPSTSTSAQVATNGASATSTTTAGATTASVISTNARSSTALSPTTTPTSAIAVSRRTAIPFAGAQKMFDEMPCKPAASNLYVTASQNTANMDDYMRGFLHVRDHCIDKASVKRLMHFKRKLAASSAPTKALTTPTTAPTVWAGRTTNRTSAHPCQGFTKYKRWHPKCCANIHTSTSSSECRR